MSTTAQPLHESYRLLIRFCAVVVCLVHLAFIPIFAGTGVHALAAGNVLSVLAYGYAYWQSRPHGNVRLAADVIALEIGLHAVAATLAIGWSSGFHYLMIPMVPVCMLSATRPRAARMGIVLCISLAYIGLRFWSSRHPPFYRLSDGLLQALEYGCLVTLFLAFITIALRYHDIIVEAHEMLRHEAFTDPLTGALNRRRLAQVATLPPAADTHSALLLCDLDHFKLVNDQYGHSVGDQVLQAFYRQLLECTRGGDHVCRWGGEEFLVLLPQTDMAVARMVAYRLRASVERTSVRLLSGELLFITVTVGLTHLGPGEPLQAAVHRADEALYRGKAAGRNQVQDSTVERPVPVAELQV